MRPSNCESSSSGAFAAHPSLLLFNAGVPFQIAEVCLADPPIKPFAILGGDNHQNLSRGAGWITKIKVFGLPQRLSSVQELTNDAAS